MTGDRAGAVIAAAGAGQRFGGDKIFAMLGGRPVLAYAVEAFERCAAVDVIVVVVAGESMERAIALERERGWKKVVAFCGGGGRRQDSVHAGLLRLPPREWVIVHDGARPFVTPEMIEAGLVAARRTGAAVAAVPAKDTIKVVGPDGLVQETPDRGRLWQAQTPQVFRRELLVAAYAESDEEVTDDAALVERRGIPVAVYPGSYDNLKITTPQDLAIAECMLRRT